MSATAVPKQASDEWKRPRAWLKPSVTWGIPATICQNSLENRRFCPQCLSLTSPTAHAVASSNLSPFETKNAIFPTHFALEMTRNAPLPTALGTEPASIPCSTITSLASLTAVRHFHYGHPPKWTDTILSQCVSGTLSTPVLLMRNLRTPCVAADARNENVFSMNRRTNMPLLRSLRMTKGALAAIDMALLRSF